MTSGASYDVHDIEEAQVTFTKSAVNATWTAKENLSILQLAEKAGLKPAFGCRSGMCVHGIEGWEPQTILICQSKPASASIEIEI
ncbi:hypothetical protein LTR53_000765 [Teratosphaeriaceae sp. CCFEE 6253]|nr:hypothetical protein LTR53_000765 [Teratosphaeriaceae sp. CCFEE 6253]